MDIDIIIKKTLVFTGLLAAVFAMLVLPTLLIQEYILREASFNGRMLGLAISGIIIILTMRRIETFLINVTDKYFFQKKYDYKELLKTFTSEVLMVLEIDRLIDLTESKLKEIIRLNSCKIEIFEGSHEYGDLVKAAKAKGYLLRSEKTDLKAELMIPVILHDVAIGMILLGKKKSDKDYTRDDLDILLPLARTLGIAISNAQLVAELGKTQAEVAQKEKMATIGTFAAGMAHEIRNPITTIRTFADFLPERYGEPRFMDTFYKLIPKEIERVAAMARSLLEFSTVEDTTRQDAFDPGAAIKQILSLIEPQYKFSGLNITSDVKDASRVFANKAQVREALFNILKYMIDEIYGSGRIHIDAGSVDDDVRMLFVSPDIMLSDYVIKGIIEPASRYAGAHRGFGFGLFVAKQLIERNGGRLSISSAAGDGTTVEVRFKKVSERRS